MASDEAVYRGMTPAELEHEYNFRARIPEHTDFIARWAADSAGMRARLRGTLNIACGPHPRQRIDLFPAGEGAPLFVFIHGGYWRGLSKDEFSFLADLFVGDGVAVATVGYGLCPDVTLEELTGHVRDAVRWLAAHAGEHGVDAGRMVLSGHSAGGHLTAEMLSTDWTAHGLPRDLIKGGIGIAGIYDLEPVRHTSVQEQLRLDAESARRASPIHHVPAPPAPPLVLAVGGDGTGEEKRQQTAYAAAWRAAGNDVEEIVVPQAHHFSVVDRLADPASRLYRAAMRMLGR
ncbi:MAG TPA: alpha/beta hydrolase [Azospirillum sp.]|nr:alpha/beta hydrolase [Azospirillum sp.]